MRRRDDGVASGPRPSWSWKVVVIFRSSPAQPPTSGTPAPSDAVGAAHDLLLVAGEPVGEQQQHPVRLLGSSVREQRRPPRRPPRAAAPTTPVGRSRSRREKPSPPRAMTTTPASPGPSVAISPAVEQPISGTPPERSPMPREQLVEVVGIGAEDDSSFGSSPASASRGLAPGGVRVGAAGPADRDPPACFVNLRASRSRHTSAIGTCAGKFRLQNDKTHARKG